MCKTLISNLFLLLLPLWVVSCSDSDDNKEKEDAVFSLVGLWSGEIGYSCSNGEHQGENGTISFEADGTGVLTESGEDPVPFSYEIIMETKIIRVVFEDGRRGEYQYEDLTGEQLSFVEICAGCGKNVTMKLSRVEPLRTITVSSTEGYFEEFSVRYDSQMRIHTIAYKLIDTDGEGDDSEGTVHVSYAPKKIRMSNALLSNHTLYTAVFTLNDKGWATKADCTYQSLEDDYSGSGTLNFTYDSRECLQSVSYSYSSNIETESGNVRMTWQDDLMTMMKEVGDDYQADVSYKTEKVPELSINLPYFMIFRYDDDTVYCGGDNVILCYASLLNILGKAPRQLMEVLRNGNDEWWSVFSFGYEWADSRLTKIHDHSSYGGRDSTSENYDAQISFSYY